MEESVAMAFRGYASQAISLASTLSLSHPLFPSHVIIIGAKCCLQLEPPK